MLNHWYDSTWKRIHVYIGCAYLRLCSLCKFMSACLCIYLYVRKCALGSAFMCICLRMCVCVGVTICVCIYVFAYEYIRPCTCLYMWTSVIILNICSLCNFMSTPLCMYFYVWKYALGYEFVCICLRMCVCVGVTICICMYVFAYEYI